MASPRSRVFPTARVVILVADLAGFHRGFRAHSDQEMATFLDRFYALAEDVIDELGGQIVKFVGDAVLAVFADDGATAAVSAAVSLEKAVMEIAAHEGLDLRLGVNVHAGSVVWAELGGGPEPTPRHHRACREPDVPARPGSRHSHQ